VEGLREIFANVRGSKHGEFRLSCVKEFGCRCAEELEALLKIDSRPLKVLDYIFADSLGCRCAEGPAPVEEAGRLPAKGQGQKKPNQFARLENATSKTVVLELVVVARVVGGVYYCPRQLVGCAEVVRAAVVMVPEVLDVLEAQLVHHADPKQTVMASPGRLGSS